MRISLGLPLNRRRAGAGADPAPVLDGVTLVDAGGGIGTLTVTFAAGEIPGTSVVIRGYIDTPADPDPANGAAVAAGVGAAATFEVTSTVGATGVSVTIVGAIDGLHDLFVAARYSSGSTWSNVVSQLGIDFDTIAPGVSSYSPADNATDVTIASDLVITFNEAMTTNVGSVSLYTDADVLVQTFDLSSVGTWTVSDTVLTLNPTSDMANSTGHYVLYSGLTDANGNALSNVTDKTVWNFTTISADTPVHVSSQRTGRFTSASTNMTFSGMTWDKSGGKVLAILSGLGVSSALPTGLTIGGNTATLLRTGQATGGTSFHHQIWEATAPSGATIDVVASFGGNVFDQVVSLYHVPGSSPTITETAWVVDNVNSQLDVSVNVSAGGHVLAAAICQDGTSYGSPPTGMTSNYSADIRSNEFCQHASVFNASAETPRSILFTDVTGDKVGVAFSFTVT